MDAALKALAEPRRRAILRLVWSQELPATAIAEHFPDVTRPAISQHLTVLKEADLVTERRDGTRRLYRANAGDDGRAAGVPRRLLDLRPRAAARRRRSGRGPQANRIPKRARARRKAGSDGRARPRDHDRRRRPRRSGRSSSTPNATSSGSAPTRRSIPGPAACTGCSSTASTPPWASSWRSSPGACRVHLRVGPGGHPIPAGSTTVEITLHPEGDKTRVRLAHRGLPDDAVSDHTGGWDHYPRPPRDRRQRRRRRARPPHRGGN